MITPRIEYLISIGKVKVWASLSDFKNRKTVPNFRPVKATQKEIQEYIDDENTYYGLKSWMDENGVLKPEYCNSLPANFNGTILLIDDTKL